MTPGGAWYSLLDQLHTDIVSHDPHFYAVLPPPADEAATRAAIAKEMHFFERVKARLRNRDAYQDFLKCLNLFAQEIITKQELVSLVQDILGRYSDLMVSGARGASLVQAALAEGCRLAGS